MPLMTDQKFQQSVDPLFEEIDANYEQRAKYPEGDPRYVNFDDKIYELRKQIIDNAMAYDRVFTKQLISFFNYSTNANDAELLDQFLANRDDFEKWKNYRDGDDVKMKCATCRHETREVITGECSRCQLNAQIRAYFHRHHPGLLKLAKENVACGNV